MLESALQYLYKHCMCFQMYQYILKNAWFNSYVHVCSQVLFISLLERWHPVDHNEGGQIQSNLQVGEKGCGSSTERNRMHRLRSQHHRDKGLTPGPHPPASTATAGAKGNAPRGLWEGRVISPLS